jgi:hypothetical protein
VGVQEVRRDKGGTERGNDLLLNGKGNENHKLGFFLYVTELFQQLRE